LATPPVHQPWGLSGAAVPGAARLCLAPGASGAGTLPARSTPRVGAAEGSAELPGAAAIAVRAGVTLDTGVPGGAIIAGVAWVATLAHRDPIDAGRHFSITCLVGRDADAILGRRTPAHRVVIDIAPVEQLASTAGTGLVVTNGVTDFVVSCIAAPFTTPDAVRRVTPAGAVVAVLPVRAIGIDTALRARHATTVSAWVIIEDRAVAESPGTLLVSRASRAAAEVR